MRAPLAQTTEVLADRSAALADERPYYSARVYDRAFGAFLGAAVGEAFGLQTKGCDAQTIADRGGAAALRFPHGRACHGHPADDWGGGTDAAVLVARALAAYSTGRADDPGRAFAEGLGAWRRAGFPELGDAEGVGCDATTARALAVPGFARAPADIAAGLDGARAGNGALVRTLACGFTAAPADWAAFFAATTHADERAAATAAALAVLLDRLARLGPEEPVPRRLIAELAEAGKARLPTPARHADFTRRLIETRRLSELHLRDQPSYAVTTLACAVWALRLLAQHPPAERGPELYERALRAVAAEGGDAPANCAVTGAVLGAALGAERLPAAWLEGAPNLAWLRREVAAFLQAVAPTWAESRPPAGW